MRSDLLTRHWKTFKSKVKVSPKCLPFFPSFYTSDSSLLTPRSPRHANKPVQPVELNPLNPKPSSRVREFPMNHIRFLQELGEGAFGKVYKGELIGLYNDATPNKVAIKTLKENALPKVQNDFRREVN